MLNSYKPSPPPTSALIGINDAWGNGSAGGLYPLDPSLNASVFPSPSVLHWRMLNSSTSQKFTNVARTVAVGTKAFCQLYGPAGCWKPPPSPTLNMTIIWDNSTLLRATVNYSCLLGYFLDNQTWTTNQTLTCYGLVGSWLPGSWTKPLLHNCTRYKVCTMPPPPPTSPNVTNTTDGQHVYLGGQITYNCPPMMGLSGGNASQTFTCVKNTTNTFNFDPPNAAPCNVCLWTPNITNASTNWLNTSTYRIGDNVTATCNTDHLFHTGLPQKQIFCGQLGWDNGTCYEACTADFPTPGANMTRANTTIHDVGTTVLYSCLPDFYLPPTAARPNSVSTMNVTCSVNHTWVWEGSLTCVQLCETGPIDAPEPATSSWDGYSRTVGTTVTLACPTPMVFGDLNTSIPLTCQDDGNWTDVNTDILICRQKCPSTPPPAPYNMSMSGESSLYWVGSNVTYTCPYGLASPTGGDSQTLICLSNNWTQFDPHFKCVNACVSPPPAEEEGVMSNNTGVQVWNTVVTYTCPYTFPTGENILDVTCHEGEWTLSTLPICALSES
nr:complement receptor type 1-like [Cherax quadricarinatus]